MFINVAIFRVRMKQETRKRLLEKRNYLTQEEVEEKSKQIIENLKDLDEYKKARKIMFYISKEKEVSTIELIKELLETKEKTVCVPKVNDEKELEVHSIESFDKLEKGSYNILEPVKDNPVDLDDIDIIIVPGAAFDKKGNRLGYGKGYYDIFLKKVNGKKIGLAYDFQLIESVPTNSDDVGMDIVVTEYSLALIL